MKRNDNPSLMDDGVFFYLISVFQCVKLISYLKKKFLLLRQRKGLNDLRPEKMLAPDSVEGTCGIVFGLSFGRRWTKSPAMLVLPNDPISLPPYLSCSPINTPPLK